MSPPYIGLPSTAFTATAATSTFLDAIIFASVGCEAPHHATALIPIAARTGEALGTRITSTATPMHWEVYHLGCAGKRLGIATLTGGRHAEIRHACQSRNC